MGLSLSGLVGRPDPLGPSDPRSLIARAGLLGAVGVSLDATAEGLRPRELDRSARRDLASHIRRHELSLTGIDAFIPPSHLTDAATVDRAVAAIRAAIGLASDIATLAQSPGGRLVCLALPKDAPPDVLSALAGEAERHGVVVADHSWPPRGADEPGAMIGAGVIGVGIDPSAVVFAGQDPCDAPVILGKAAAAARVSDLAAVGRVMPGSGYGRLDLERYRATLAVCGFRGTLVVDVRGLDEPWNAAGALLAQSAGGLGPSPAF